MGRVARTTSVVAEAGSWADVVRESQEIAELALEGLLRLAAVSHDLRRDREPAFSGAEDLTPSPFYAEADATRAWDGARLVVELVQPAVLDR